MPPDEPPPAESGTERPADPDAPPDVEDPRPGWARLHLWQIQWVRDVLVFLAVFGLFVLGGRLSIVTVPLLLALLFAYLFEPLVKWLVKRPWLNRTGAASGILVVTAAVIVVPVVIGASVAFVQGVRLAGKIAGQTNAVVASVEAPKDEALRDRVNPGAWRSIRDFVVELAAEAKAAGRPAQPPSDAELEIEEASAIPDTFLGADTRDLLEGIQIALDWVRQNAEEIGRQALRTGQGAVGVAVATLGSIGRFFFQAFLTAFFFFFISTGWGAVLEFGRGLLPTKNRERVEELVLLMDRAIAGFVRGRLSIAFAQAVFFTVGYWLIGVPAPLLLGPAVAILSIVPYAALVGIPISITLLWLEPSVGFRAELWWVVGAPIGIYMLGQALDDYVLTPLIQGKSTNMDTPTILFASIAGGALMGFYGLLVAIPLAACVKILIREVFWPRFKDWAEGRERDFLPIE